MTSDYTPDRWSQVQVEGPRIAGAVSAPRLYSCSAAAYFSRMLAGRANPSPRAGDPIRWRRLALAALIVLPLPAIGSGLACTGSDGVVEPKGGSVSSSTSSGTSSASSSSSGGGGGGAGGSSAGDAGDAGNAGDASEAGDACASDDAAIVCDTMVQVVVPEAGVHVPLCTVVTYPTTPPTWGPHYPIWAAYKTYAVEVPPGFFVHGQEHGAVTIGYNCPCGCDAELAQLDAFLAARPADPLCDPDGSVKARIVVTPNPDLAVRFAAGAWGAYLKSNCLDLQAIGSFLDNYYGKGPESSCYDGYDVAQGIPPNCGEPIDAGAPDAPEDG